MVQVFVEDMAVEKLPEKRENNTGISGDEGPSVCVSLGHHNSLNIAWKEKINL